MQRASIIVLIVGVLIGLAIAQAAAGATTDHITIAPAQSIADQPEVQALFDERFR